ncbi:MAG: pterin-4-alpha-carbinolamine dehydratase [Bacteroidetes bacterium]|jgi:4a-hydroxytetrahydrobiopterin dehydratase|nr:pterin-4-alpha-carbinolamine dehydratase [Bacteroidota bacterium]
MQNWEAQNNKLTKTFEFQSFEEAIEFMVRASEVISQMDHHPEWTNVYNRVMVSLCTHDAGNVITQKDHDLAAALDAVFQLGNSV